MQTEKSLTYKLGLPNAEARINISDTKLNNWNVPNDSKSNVFNQPLASRYCYSMELLGKNQTN